MRPAELWKGLFRITVGLYWLFFASQKWAGIGWMRPLIEAAPAANPIPGLHEILAVVVAPHWFLFAVAQAAGETVVGLLLVLGLRTGPAAVLGLLLAANLALVVAFESPDPGFRWLYYLGVLVNAQLVFADAGWPALGSARFVPGWLRG
ncbi:MAG: hypothetical protein NVS9B1_26780 [Candidatus Dormibacteraceae bacterium]